MARKTIKVEIPRSPDEMINLAKNIVSKYKKEGTGSPLKSEEISMLESKSIEAEMQRNKARDLHKQAEAAMEASNLALGIAKGQTKDTKNTVYYLLTGIRDILLTTHRGEEEKLSEWGFNVVVKSHTPKGRKKKTT